MTNYEDGRPKTKDGRQETGDRRFEIMENWGIGAIRCFRSGHSLRRTTDATLPAQTAAPRNNKHAQNVPLFRNEAAYAEKGWVIHRIGGEFCPRIARVESCNTRRQMQNMETQNSFFLQKQILATY